MITVYRDRAGLDVTARCLRGEYQAGDVMQHQRCDVCDAVPVWTDAAVQPCVCGVRKFVVRTDALGAVRLQCTRCMRVGDFTTEPRRRIGRWVCDHDRARHHMTPSWTEGKTYPSGGHSTSTTLMPLTPITSITRAEAERVMRNPYADTGAVADVVLADLTNPPNPTPGNG